MLLEYLIHGGEFLYIPADPIQPVDHDRIQPAGLYVCHHFPEAGPVGVLSGKAFVFIVDNEFCFLILVNNTGVILAELDLYLDRIAVITIDGFAGVNSDGEHNIILQYRVYELDKNYSYKFVLQIVPEGDIMKTVKCHHISYGRGRSGAQFTPGRFYLY